MLWTLVLLVVAIVLVVSAMASLADAQQACFFSSNVACPDGHDWRVGLLTFAFFGVPLIWLGGVVVAIAGRAVAKRQRERRP